MNISNDFILHISLYNDYLKKLEHYIKFYKNLYDFYNKFYDNPFYNKYENIDKCKYTYTIIKYKNKSLIEEKIKLYLENEHIEKEKIVYTFEDILFKYTYDKLYYYDDLDYYSVQKYKIYKMNKQSYYTKMSFNFDPYFIPYSINFKYGYHIKYDDYIYDKKIYDRIMGIKRYPIHNNENYINFLDAYIIDIWLNDYEVKIKNCKKKNKHELFKKIIFGSKAVIPSYSPSLRANNLSYYNTLRNKILNNLF